MSDTAAAKLPDHIAIVMDGNGRWAQKRNKPRTFGHLEGLSAAKNMVKVIADGKLARYLSLYAFSTENWRRAEQEVSFLMGLVVKHLKKEAAFYRLNRVRVRHSGNLAGLPSAVRKELDLIMQQTADFDRLQVNLAINYGGRDEIVRAAQRLLTQTADDGRPMQMSEQSLRGCFDCPDIPDPDLIIRSGGEQRLSNFLLWQAAYSEFYFSQTLWPDWTADDLYQALEWYRNRHRRFGKES